jgi:putative endonuclease
VRERRPAVYLIANHKQGAQYACKTLVWFEMHDAMTTAFAREKQIKGGPRRKKIEQIAAQNPEWRDLYLDLF